MKADVDHENQQPGRQTREVIASPNPTIKEADPAEGAEPPAVTSTRIEGAPAAKQAPMKKARKPKRTTKPRND